MSAQEGFADDLLDLIFTNVAAPNVGDAGGLQPSAVANSFYISLHTVALLDSVSDQTVNEAAYTGPYTRVAVARSIAQWTVLAQNVDNDNAITFPTATSAEVEVHFGIGFAAAGIGVLSMSGDLVSDLAVSNGITPEFAAGALDVSLA